MLSHACILQDIRKLPHLVFSNFLHGFCSFTNSGNGKRFPLCTFLAAYLVGRHALALLKHFVAARLGFHEYIPAFVVDVVLLRSVNILHPLFIVHQYRQCPDKMPASIKAVKHWNTVLVERQTVMVLHFPAMRVLSPFSQYTCLCSIISATLCPRDLSNIDGSAIPVMRGRKGSGLPAPFQEFSVQFPAASILHRYLV